MKYSVFKEGFLRTCYGLLMLGLLFIFNFCSVSEDITALDVKSFPDRQRDFSLWQLESFYETVQMGYILKTDDDKIIVIDGGDEKTSPILESYLRQFNGKVDTWIITHPHLDHIGSLMGILEKGDIRIDRILYVPLNEAWVQKYEPLNYDLVVRYHKLLALSEVKKIPMIVGDEMVLGDGVQMKVLGGMNEDFVSNAINNSSLVFKITSTSKSILFTGDLGIEGGKEVLKRNDLATVQADYIQMAHHGQAGVNKDFYVAVQAKYALWPTPKWLWNNQLAEKEPDSGTYKTLIVRSWMEELSIQKNYVSGIDGTMQID